MGSRKEHTSDSVIKWLKEHPLISVNRLEIAAKLCEGTIKHPMNGTRAIPQKHIPSLVKLLQQYGLK